MGVPSRALTLAALGVLATTAAVGVLPGTSAHGTAALAAAATTAPCIPNSPPPGYLPQPPVVDASRTPNFTLYVKQGANSQTGQTYCYTTSASGATAYVEAPTIRIRQGWTFTMTLVNQIPYTGPSPVPTPQSSIIPTSDGCAWLPNDGPTFPPADPSLVPSGYFNHPRAHTETMPPWMLSNDTNFHTHGWHVDPYVDNVYKSLVWAPNANTCVYKFVVPRTQPPGTYWYHAHLHGLSDAQVGGGLAGTLIVDPAAGAIDSNAVLLMIKNSPRNQTPTLQAALPTMKMPEMGRPERVQHYNALLSHVPLRAGPGAAATPVPFPAFFPPPWNSGFPYTAGTPYCAPQPTLAQVSPLVVNGALIPVVLGGTATPSVGPQVTQLINTVRRYRILNAASDAYVNIQTVMDGGTVVPLSVLARDGVPVNWNFETSKIDPLKPSVVVEPNVFVPPSGRVDIAVYERGRTLTIVSLAGTSTQVSADGTPFCEGYFGATIPRRNILRIQPFVGPTAKRSMAVPTATVQQHTQPTTAALLVAHDLPKVTKSRAITFTMYRSSPCCNWNVTETGEYNGPNPPRTVLASNYTERPFFLAPSNPLNTNYPYMPWIKVHKHAVEEWSIYNASGEIHAFHIHQLTFVALKSPFEATNQFQQVFLDSIALPAASLVNPSTKDQYPLMKPSLTKILIDFRNVDPGVFVFHCHMLFHEDHGMMGVIEVLPN